MADEYNTPLDDVSTTAIELDCPDCGTDAIERMSTKGRTFVVRVAKKWFTGNRKWRYHTEDPPGLNRADSHMQGIQCKDDYLFITAGDWLEPAAHMFIARMKRQDGWPTEAEVTRIVCIDCNHPHAGGIQRLGNLLAVPLEAELGGSEIAFFDITDPEDPLRVGGSATLPRENPKASAVAVAQLPNGQLLLGTAWAHSLDLNLSIDDDPRNGWLMAQGAPATTTLQLAGLFAAAPAYQSVTFLKPFIDTTTNAVRVPVVAARNTRQGLSDWWKGKDFADVFELVIPPGKLADWSSTEEITIDHVHDAKRFETSRGNGNFCAGVGIDVEAIDRCTLYATHHWRTDDGIKVTAFRAS